MKIVITLDVEQGDPSKPINYTNAVGEGIEDTVEYFACDDRLSGALYDIHNLNVTMIGAEVVK